MIPWRCYDYAEADGTGREVESVLAKDLWYDWLETGRVHTAAVQSEGCYGWSVAASCLVPHDQRAVLFPVLAEQTHNELVAARWQWYHGLLHRIFDQRLVHKRCCYLNLELVGVGSYN